MLIKKFGLNRSIARKTLKSSVITGDVILSSVHNWWLHSYDVLNGFGVKVTDKIQ